jgi:two-component system cell cycle sensor histidine kinase/response regulator CckA
LLTGCVVLLGWILRVRALAQVLPGLSTMKFNTALCVALLGLALWFCVEAETGQIRRWASLVLASLEGLVALLTVLEYSLRADFGIDQVFLRDPWEQKYPGRPGMNTAMALLALSVAIVCLNLRRKWVRNLPPILGMFSGLFSLTALLGYVYSLESDTGLASGTGMALHTATCVFLLSIGVLTVKPVPGLELLREEPEVAKLMVSKLMLLVFVAPILGGWIALWGERLGLYGQLFRLAVLAGFLAVMLAFCTYYTSLRMAELSSLRRKAQEGLRTSEARLRAILDTEPACVKLLASDCRLLQMNKAGLAMIEADSSEQVVGASVLGIVDGPYRQGFQELTSQVFRGMPGRMQFEATGLKGARVWLETLATPLRDDKGAIESALGITRDMTQQKIAEQALTASERKFVSIFNSSPDAITISEFESGIYVEANRAYLEMTGYSREEILGKSALQLGVWADPEARKQLSDMLENSGVVRAFDADLRRKSGEVFATQLSAEVIEIDGVKCFLVIVRDVSDRKKLEEQLRQAQKMEAVGQLAGGVAHDFNNMLMIMLSYAELIQNAGGVNPQIADYSSRIRKAGESAGSITRQLLAFSRKQVMEFKIQSLNAVVRDLGKMLPRLIGEHIEVVLALDENLPPVKLDRGQMEQVLVNLAVNARDAMAKGGKLTIETATKNFDRSYADVHPPARMGNYVMLSVSDTGIGMDRETQTRIFEPFFTTKSIGKGTGLGLATVYGIVKQSDGFIWVYSEPGQGTSFKIYLPITSGKAEAAQASEQHEGAATGSEVILLVEDEEDVRNAIGEYLTGRGYKLISARDGDEALRLCKTLQQSPDLVLTDVVMPGELSGPDVILAVRRLFPAIKSILMSGYTDRHFDYTDANASIRKPISLRELNMRIRQVMAGAG